MQIKTFKGSYFQIGEQFGQIYKKNGMTFDHVKIDPHLYKAQLRIYKQHYPELLEELEGVAKGGNFNKELLVYNFLTSEIIFYRNKVGLDRACTIFGYKAKGDLFIGRNYDWIPETDDIFEIYKITTPNKNSYLAFTDMGIGSPETAKPKYFFYNADDAINEKGLFIGLTFAYADQWSYGISCIHMTKLIAETCGTVEEAIKVLRTVPLCCPKNFFIADKNGDMAIVEHTSKKMKVIYPENSTLIQTNHYVDPELAKEDTVLEKKPHHNTFIRYYETLQKINLERKTFQLDSIAKVLRRKGSYTFQDFPEIKTIWTLALDMKKKRYKIYWDENGHEKSKILEV